MTSATAEAPIEIETGNAPRAAVIWLHGLGADGQDFVPIVPELRLPRQLSVRFVFPHAPYRPVALNGGHVMRAWYDMNITERGLWQDPTHIGQSVEAVHGLVRRETARGIEARRIVLAGFSQGGVVALHAGLSAVQPLAGLLVLSAAVPQVDELLALSTPVSAGIPIFLAQGLHDPVVPYALGEAMFRVLKAAGRPVAWHPYPIAHTVSAEEVAAIGEWLVERFA